MVTTKKTFKKGLIYLFTKKKIYQKKKDLTKKGYKK